ncbi:hypothetical protein VKT23_015776 [Stygiomarasmius scandens]|uniref:Fe2OG dioxygenase domain-containing protein n=1 Tax=Marasmiellus scandens TaxID=2682957 RepID=A0ABR1IY06_9AGAR
MPVRRSLPSLALKKSRVKKTSTRKRGKRSKEAAERRARKRYEHLKAVLDETTAYFESRDYSGDIPGDCRSGQKILDLVAEVFGDVTPDELKSAPEDGILIWKTPQCMLDSSPSIPPVSLIRLHNILGTDDINLIIDFYDTLIRSGFRIPREKNGDRNRSFTDGVHLGVWQLYSSEPMITSSSRFLKQRSSDVLELLDKFLMLLRNILAPIIRSIYQIHLPHLWARQQKAHRYVNANIRPTHQAEYESRLALDFNGAFFGAAVKEGSSEIFHVDWNDDPNTLTWIVPLGDGWEGGEFCVPQLNTKVPVKQGQLIGALTRRLIHCGTPTQGRRLVLTLFCDRYLMGHSERWIE